MRRPNVLGLLLAGLISVGLVGSADAKKAKREPSCSMQVAAPFLSRAARNNCPWPKEIVRNVEVCVGAKLPRANIEFVTALKACNGEEGCINAAVIKRDGVRDSLREADLRRKLEKQMAVTIGNFVLSGLVEAGQTFQADAKLGNVVIDNPEALGHVIELLKSARDEYAKATTPK